MGSQPPPGAPATWPLVADAFGDSDTAELAAAARCVEDAARIGFRTRQTLAGSR
ncbi:MAG: hypothetical protein WDN31_15500 [Hyphomicrobium sp.]